MSVVAVDWGTSNLRAWRLDEAGRPVESTAAPAGVMQIADGDFGGAFARHVAPLAPEGMPVVMFGTIGSRQGWREVPYAECPAGLPDVVARLTAVTSRSGRRLHIVPGICQAPADGLPDVMRGEEVQIFGALRGDAAEAFVLPGTHSKWARAEGGRIQAFATFMTGETFAALRGHTILGRLMPAEAEAAPDDPGFAAGLERAERGDLLHSLFGARTLGLFERLPMASLPSYLSGLLIGSEIVAARAAGWAEAPLTIVGSDRLTALYGAAFDRFGLAWRRPDHDPTIAGLWRIFTAAREAGTC
ncbi:MAG TPA: 2-dehydro-3-deoxygalactonokinase [Alphaproteobacteria bacterium]|nr:2-dehydro-3-deoxygalactonokinase [Alphaproteobacteria bacterium]